MLNTAGLDLVKSPPISVPLSFFLAAPPFAIAAGLLLAVGDGNLLASRWTAGTLAATHLLLLGFVTPIMCGSLLQLLPVFVGTPTSVSATGARILSLGLASGTALLAAGLATSQAIPLQLGAVLLAAVLLTLAGKVLHALLSSTARQGMRLALGAAILALAITVFLGMLLVGLRNGWITMPAATGWTDTHLAWGLAGWMGLLVLSVASELIPMFYLATAPSPWLRNWLIMMVLVLLALTTLARVQGQATLAAPGLLILYACIAVAGIVMQMRRRRPKRDACLGFWWLGQCSLIAATAAWLLNGPTTLTGVLIIVGAALSFTTGTLFKIVPFLCWYHLQTRKVLVGSISVRLPNMQSFMSEGAARALLALHGTTLLLAVAGTLQTSPVASMIAEFALALSAAFLWWLLVRAWSLYRHVLRQLEE